jgi:CBS domain-containing protein
MDWAASGLPVEGNLDDVPRAGQLARRDVPTCQLTDRIGDVRKRVEANGRNGCVVVNEQGVVLGRLGKDALTAESDRTVEDVMEPGPSTFRPNVSLFEMLDYLRDHDMKDALITSSDGRLVGLLLRSDVEQELHETPSREASAAGQGR